MPLPVEIPISKYFSPDRRAEIDGYLKDRLESLVRGNREIRETKVTNWRRIYSGTPRDKSKSFPWQNASNLVPQIVGSFVDQLTAKIIMGILGIDPFWVALLGGEFKQNEHGEDQREAVEAWLVYAGLEPSHMNLLMKYIIWVRTMVKYGLGAIKLLPELTVEKVAQHVSADGKVSFTDFVRHDGPVALPLVFEDFLIPPTTTELERSPIVTQRAIMQRYQLEAWKFDKTIDKDNLEDVLKTPDRQGPDPQRQAVENDTGVRTDAGGKISDEWDIYENYFPYLVNGTRFHLIATYHLGTKKMLKAVFNWLPENSIPYVTGRLGSDGERAYGFGFCEMLQDYQEEVAAIHNQRRDASTLANTNLLRVDPGTQLDSQFSIYPNALMPAGKDQVEIIPLGRGANETIKDEQMVLQEAQDRAGIGPSSSGQGAGTVNKKGVYSAMGTFSTMQEGNTRANLNVTEFKQSHYIVGRLALLYYSHFGVREADVRALGQQGQWLKKALENYKAGRIILPIRAASASINKEIEKQNLMLLLNNMRAHWQQVSQLLQAASNPMAPPEYQDYLFQVIMASNLLMKKIAREFAIPDPSSLLPEPMGVQEKSQAIQKQAMMQKIQQMIQQQQGQLPQGAPPPAGPPQGAPSALPPEAVQ